MLMSRWEPPADMGSRHGCHFTFAMGKRPLFGYIRNDYVPRRKTRHDAHPSPTNGKARLASAMNPNLSNCTKAPTPVLVRNTKAMQTLHNGTRIQTLTSAGATEERANCTHSVARGLHASQSDEFWNGWDVLRRGRKIDDGGDGGVSGVHWG
jgi:hypothetical protein